jgi:hypothetical protein
VKKVFMVTTMAVMSAMVVSSAAAIGITSAAGAAGTVAGGAPIIRASGQGSTHGLPTIAENWSGYAVTSKWNEPFTYVSSEFVQPAVTCNGMPLVNTSNWVGLDGFNDDTVEQDGTGATCKRPDYVTPGYYAWIEMYPLPTVRAFGVKPGDTIKASVSYSTGGKFTLSIADLTSGMSKTVVDSCTSCARASAEWIIERPAGCNQSETKCFLFALANFGSTTMSKNLAAIQGGKAEKLSSFANSYPIFMVQPNAKGFRTLDTTSGVSPSNSFTETWDKYGKVTPITLGPKR